MNYLSLSLSASTRLSLTLCSLCALAAGAQVRRCVSLCVQVLMRVCRCMQVLMRVCRCKWNIDKCRSTLKMVCVQYILG
jgi:hypothetical protein